MNNLIDLTSKEADDFFKHLAEKKIYLIDIFDKYDRETFKEILGELYEKYINGEL